MHGFHKTQIVLSEVSKMEDDIAAELERKNAEAVRHEQTMKRVYESSEELRSLKSKLHAAQVNKERHSQLVEQLVLIASFVSGDFGCTE